MFLYSSQYVFSFPVVSAQIRLKPLNFYKVALDKNSQTMAKYSNATFKLADFEI